MSKSSKGLVAVALFALATVTASATTITGSVQALGSVPAFSSPPNPNSSNTTASQFNATAVNAAIQAACPTGKVCSALTLTDINFTLTANLSGSLDVVNTSGSSQQISSINGMGGTNGVATSGTAIQGTASMTLYDPIGNALVVVLPTFNVATNTQIGSGAARQRVLTVSTGTTHFSGSGSDTKYGSYSTSACPDTNDNGCIDATVLSTYVGSGSVNFGLGLNGSVVLGSQPNGVGTANNVSNITGGSVTIDYNYSYEMTDAPSVPEPSSMALAGSALMAAGVLARRFAKK